MDSFSKDLKKAIAKNSSFLKSLPKPQKQYNSTPWEDQKDAFFKANSIEHERFNRLYPYRLLVYDVSKGQIARIGQSKSQTKTTSKTTPKGIQHIISQQETQSGWEFVFPISPQQLSITDQYAIDNQPTFRGIVENHNGVKYKIIQIQGTTGIWANKPTIGDAPKNPSILQTAFESTISAALNVAKRADKLAQAFTGKNSGSKIQSPDFNDMEQTGYYKALYLSQFLEQYTISKKDPKNKHLRLIFDIPKENQSYIVTPQNFTLTKSQQKPNEYIFSMTLRAWKRINLDEPPFASNEPLNIGQANVLQRINNTIRETRKLISASTNVISAARSDAQQPLNILRQVALTTKDLGNFAFTLADLPSNIANDYKSSIKESMSILSNSFKRQNYTLNTSNTQLTTSTPQFSLSNTKRLQEGLTEAQYKTLSPDAQINTELDPTNQIFENPTNHFTLFDEITIDEVNFTPTERDNINQSIEADLLTSIPELNEAKQEILNLYLDLSNYFGASNNTFSTTYNRPNPKTRSTPLSEEENELLQSLFETIQAMDSLTSTTLFDQSILSSLQYVGQLASEVGITIEDSISKYLVPVPFNSTLEQISAKYLNTPDRWIEIATINNLRSPYIDETGFTYQLLSNGSETSFTVSTNNNLYIGQKIQLQSNIIPPFISKITNIEKINDSNYLVTTNSSNLTILTTLHNARMTAYLPGTVNSQDSIYIPSNIPSKSDNINTIPQYNQDTLTRLSKVDWLLDDNQDIAINAQGEVRLANGLNNLVQALKLKIVSKKNSLLRHPDFGVGIQHGISISDIESGIIYQEIQSLVLADDRFQGIERLDIIIDGGTISIDLSVKLANGSGIIPISFKV